MCHQAESSGECQLSSSADAQCQNTVFGFLLNHMSGIWVFMATQNLHRSIESYDHACHLHLTIPEICFILHFSMNI